MHLVFPVFLSRYLLPRKQFVPPPIHYRLIQETFRVILQDFSSYHCCIPEFPVTGIVSLTFREIPPFLPRLLITSRQHSSDHRSYLILQLEAFVFIMLRSSTMRLSGSLALKNSIMSSRDSIPLPCKTSRRPRLSWLHFLPSPFRFSRPLIFFPLSQL